MPGWTRTSLLWQAIIKPQLLSPNFKSWAPPQIHRLKCSSVLFLTRIWDLLRYHSEKGSSLPRYPHREHYTSLEMVAPALLLSTNHSHASCWEALKYNQMLCMTRLSKSILQKVLLTTLFSATRAILLSPKYSRHGQGQVKNPKSTGEKLLPTPRDFESLTLTVRTSSRFAIPCQVPLSMLSTGLFYPSASTVINRIKVRYSIWLNERKFYFYQYKCDRFPATNP